LTDDGLPEDWTIELDPGTRRTDDGHVLIGGSPLRVIRLTDAGARQLDADLPPRSAGWRRLARRLVDAGVANPRPAATDLRAADVAVVIPVRDDADGLRRTLASIADVGEIIVVDDGSRNPVPAAALRNERPMGPAAARERGWRATTKPMVAFVDADVELPAGWLTTLLAHLGDPSVAAVAPRIATSRGGSPTWLAAYEAVRSPLDLGASAGQVRPAGKVPYVPTTALVVRREALESVDGFDVTLHVGEDVDLVWRLHAHGWRIRYEPGVLARHPTRSTLARWVGQRVRYGTSAAPLARRHGRAVAPLGISGWSAAAWTAVLFRRPAVAATIAAATTAALTPKLRGLQHPGREAVEIAGKGHLRAGRYAAEAVRRTWWPLALVLAVGRPRTRPALLAAAIVPPALEWRERRPALDPVRFTALRLIDDAAYGTGVWLGCWRERSIRALLPSFSGPLPPPE